MMIQCIYTYEVKEQEMIDFLKPPKNIMDSQSNFIDYMRLILNDEEHDELVKISACVTSKENMPKWYMDCNGKFYFKNGKLI